MKLYVGHQAKSNSLFIFDDVWDKRHFDKLKAVKKSIVTSRFNLLGEMISDNEHYFPLPVSI